MLTLCFRLCCLIISVLFTLAACAMPPGSYSRTRSGIAEKMYRYEEGGKKTLVYEVDKTGKLIIHDPSDKRAQDRMAQQKYEQQAEQKRAARMDKIRRAPKRKQNDPISVYFHPIEPDRGIELSDKQKQDMFNYFKKQLENDPVLRLVVQKKTKSRSRRFGRALKALSSGMPKSDVDLKIMVSTKSVYGFIKGKPAEAKAMVFKATIKSNWLPETRTAQESGTLFQIPAASKKLGRKIKRVIKEELGPTIPADRSL